ncbi:hypothetical protein GGF46_001714 [Coemansia sp. RSA 552]|nr:hypothetical protein GGF46_001714 [Coemansia sp. RSA 552]
MARFVVASFALAASVLADLTINNPVDGTVWSDNGDPVTISWVSSNATPLSGSVTVQLMEGTDENNLSLVLQIAADVDAAAGKVAFTPPGNLAQSANYVVRVVANDGPHYSHYFSAGGSGSASDSASEHTTEPPASSLEDTTESTKSSSEDTTESTASSSKHTTESGPDSSSAAHHQGLLFAGTVAVAFVSQLMSAHSPRKQFFWCHICLPPEDNRLRTGVAVIVSHLFQAALAALWWGHYAEAGPSSRYPQLLAQSSAFAALAAIGCVGALACSSNRLCRAGLFPWPLPALAAVQLLVGLGEMYFSFFTPHTSNVPICGRHASPRANLLTATTLVSIVTQLLYLHVQWRPVFSRPHSESAPHTLAVDDVEAMDEPDSDVTPLAKPTDQRTDQLLDTPELGASWLSMLTFAWMDGLLSLGTKRQLEQSDLYRLQPADTPIHSWKRFLGHRKPGRSLFRTLLLTFAPELILQSMASILTTMLQFAGPFFLQRIIRFIEQGSSTTTGGERSMRSAYLDAFGLLLFTLLQTMLSGKTLWIGQQITIRFTGLIVAELSAKTLQRCGKGGKSSEQHNNKTGSGSGDDGDESATEAVSDGKIMNLLTADVDNVGDVVSHLYDIYGLPLTLLAGIWYMYTLLGVSALIGLGVGIAYIPLSKLMFQYLIHLKTKYLAISDERVTAITELLQGIKAVKLFGWETQFLKRIDQTRERQLDLIWRLQSSWLYISAVTSLAPMLVLIIIFAAYVIGFGHQLTAEVAFTSISVFRLVHLVFEHLPGFMSYAVGAYVSLRRIDSYLGQPDVQRLEERVGASGDDEGVLGFSNADLEWENTSASEFDDEAVQRPTELATEELPLLQTDSQLGLTVPRTGSGTLVEDTGMTAFSLKNIDLHFPQGGLSVVSGAVGSGKSSLLSALIGEMSLVRGRILLPTASAQQSAGHEAQYQDIIELSKEGLAIRDIAYVAQEAWLRNATIRENILFGESYDKQRYEEVLRVCALKPDLRILKAGDQTEIGERGVTLSGGQKQRVALARAVYSSRRILLIDDCLSAVDAHTAKHILMECLVSETPLMHGRTRVLVTHHVSMCLPHVQFVVMLHRGEVSFKGTPGELQAQGTFSKMLAALEKAVESQQPTSGEEADTSMDTEQLLYSSDDNASAKDHEKTVNDLKPEDEYNAERLQKIAEQRGLDPLGDLSALEGSLVEDEERESGSVKLRVWLTFLSACGNKRFWAVSCTLMIMHQAITMLHTYWIRIWVASVNSNDSQVLSALRAASIRVLAPVYETRQGTESGQQQHSAVYWLGMYMFIGMAGIVWITAAMLYIYFGWVRASRSLHAGLLHAVVHARPRFFDSTPLGRIINRFSRDIQTIDEISLGTFIVWLTSILEVAGAYVIITTVVPTFIGVACIVTCLYAAIGYYYLNASRELKRLEATAMSPLLSLFSELIPGVSTVRAFGAKHYYMKEALARISAYSRSYYMVWASNRWLSVRIDFAGAWVSFGCALFILMNIEKMDAGLAGFTLSYALSFSMSMIWVIRNYTSNELNMNAVERIDQYLALEQEAPLHVTPADTPPASWPATGDLRIEDLVVEYVPGTPVLHGVTLSVSHGEKIGIVGRTGSGKSTLSLSLLRFIEAAEGRILLDGVDISRVGLEDLRRRVTIIPQDPVLFNGTIRFNLDPFGEYPDELVWDALRRTHLVRERSGSQTASTAVSIVDGSGSEGNGLDQMSGIFTSLDAEIKENGQNLSLGQRQLVALARALVRRSRLIIMDEATASVDFDTDERIQRTIRGLEFSDSTLLCIAHRLRTIIDYDRVLVLDKGRVAEFNTPWNLLQNAGGIFHGMCEKSGEYAHLEAAANGLKQQT